MKKYAYSIKNVNFPLLVFELEEHQLDWDALPETITCNEVIWSKTSMGYVTIHPGELKVKSYVNDFVKQFDKIIQ